MVDTGSLINDHGDIVVVVVFLWGGSQIVSMYLSRNYAPLYQHS